MTIRAPLPDPLGTAFTVSEATAHGVSRSRLRSADLETPTRGARVVVDAEPTHG